MIDPVVRYPLLACAALCFAVPVDAQNVTPPATDQSEAEPPDASGGEVVVTATKRTASTIQETPIAVQALAGDTLRARGALEFADYFRSVPGLATQDEGPGDKRYVIRGINSTGASTVGVYIDEVIVTGENSQDGSGQNFDVKLFDIDRVEVLKGPQGTTFGSNSMAGTIRFITAKPKLGVTEGYIQSSLRSTDGASLGYQADGAVNLSVVPDRLALRGSFYVAELPGYIDSRFQKGANRETDRALRLQARLDVSDRLTLNGMFLYQRVYQGAKNYYNLFGYDGRPLSSRRLQQADYARTPFVDDAKIYNLTATYNTGVGTVTGTVSRFDRFTSFTRDASLAAQAFFGRPFATSGQSAISQPRQRRVDSAELRFASNFGGAFELLVGGFAQDETRDFESTWRTVQPDGRPSPNPLILLNRTLDTRVREFAGFGEASYKITDTLTATAGVRAFDFRLKQVVGVQVRAGGAPGPGNGAAQGSKDSGVISRFNLAYKPNRDVNAYVQVAQGYRPGGVNDAESAATVGVVLPNSGFGSDDLWNYEAGIKTAHLNRTLFVNASIFYIDWSKIQNFALATNGTFLFAYISNGGRASVKGFEATLDYKPTNALTLGATLGYNDAKLETDNPDPTTGLKGDQIPFVPKWNASANFLYTFPIGDGGLRGQVGGDISTQSRSATKYNQSIGNFVIVKPYSIANLRAGLRNGRYSFDLSVTNLFNDRTIINANDIVVGLYPAGYYINRPRTFTASLTTRF